MSSSFAKQIRLPWRVIHAGGDCTTRRFHDLPRRAVMEKCAFDATHAPEIRKTFMKVMSTPPVSKEIIHRTGTGKRVHGSGASITVKEAVSNTPLAHGKAALASEISQWVEQLIPREKRVLDHGVDAVFLNQLLAAVEKLKTHPKLPYVCQAMANECHKPAPSIDVEMGEFLYGLSDSFNIIKEAHAKGMVASSTFLDTASGRKAKHVVGGHPSNFVVYVCPVLEAIAQGWPAVILNHPQVPTAASQFIDLLEECGVNFDGKLVHATTSNIEELCKVFKGKDSEISQGILIAGLNMGRTISQHAPNTKQELSGSNELVMTPEQFRQEPGKYLDSLKINLGYSAGKQCTAPSKLIFAGFKDPEIKSIQGSLQTWSDHTKAMPARDLRDFTSNVPYLFNNDPGNIHQFKSNTKSFTPFVTGHRPLFRLNDSHKVDEVFGPATALQFVDSMKDVKLSSHSLSMGINVDVTNNRQGLQDFLKDKDLKNLPSIINVGFNASTLAATPTGEAFLPWHYTLSGQDVGMGPHAPLRFCSYQVSNAVMNANAAHFKDGTYRKVVDTAVAAMQAHSGVFGKIDAAHASAELLSNAVESDRSLQPTLNARVLNDRDCKMTLYMCLKIDEKAFVRLTAEDTPEIRRNMVAYTLQLARQGVPVHVSAGPNVDGAVLRAMEACVGGHKHVKVGASSDADFVASLEKQPRTVITSDEDFKVKLKNESHFLTVFPGTRHNPFLVVGLKPQTVKVSGSLDDCVQTLLGFVEARKGQAPVAVTSEHMAAQVAAVKDQVALLRKKATIAKYERWATPHYKGKVKVVAHKTEGVRIIEADGTYYLDCNLAYGAAKAGFTPDVSAYQAANGNANGCACQASMSVLPSQAMYTWELSTALERLSSRYAKFVLNPDEEDVQVMVLNSGGEIMDSIQQAIRRSGGPNTVILYPKGNFNGRREHANKLNQNEELPHAFNSNCELNVDSAGRCYVEFNNPQELLAVAAACKSAGRAVGIIWEPIQGEGGIFVSTPEYVKAINDLQARGELIVCSDEVQTGFAGDKAHGGLICAHLGVKPDILALAKSLTLGKVAGSAALLRSSFAKKAFPPGVDGGTFSGMPFASHMILAADDFWHSGDALDRLYKLGNDRKDTIAAALVKTPNPHVHAVKGVGSMGAVQFTTGPDAHHYHYLFMALSEPGVMHPSYGPLPKGLKGIIQKLSGKNSNVMRMTSGLSDNAADQEEITKLICHLLTHPHYYPKAKL